MDLKKKKLLIIVESPHKSKVISKILKDAGYTKAVVMASVGHISNLKDNRSSYKNTGIYPNEGFRLNLAVSEDKKSVVTLLKEQVKLADYVYLMTDGDREGEAISWSLVQFLKLKDGTYFRAITHEITPKAVLQAIEHPVELNNALVEAAHARMAVDKMVGYALSPVARTYIGAKSVGRCQSAGLKLVVDREKEIQSFIPETYYDLYLQFSKNKIPFKAKYIGTDTKPIDHIESLTVLNKIKTGCNEDYKITSIKNKEKHEAPKPPFCTSSFQQEAANKLGLKVKDAMSVAQKLFESGFITYHRTDDTILGDEFIPQLQAYIADNYPGEYIAPRQGKVDANAQNGHEAIRVTNINLTPNNNSDTIINDLQKKVYDLIWKRTIASAMPDALYAETVYTIHNADHKFELISTILKNIGYRKVYSYVDTVEDTAVKEIFTDGEILSNCVLEEVAKQTTPPARYKEASLVKELQKQGIGRPSTFATIVETVLSDSRGYCKLEDKYIVPTERGIQLSAFLDRAFPDIINLNYTKNMENDLDSIAEQRLDRFIFLQKFYESLEDAVSKNTEEGPRQVEKVCPKCGAAMVIRRSRFGKLFYGCSNYPNCTGIINM